MAKSNAKGRDKYIDAVMLNRFEMRTQAYRYLSTYGRSALLELLYHFDGKNNGHIALSVRQLAKALNCGVKKASNVFKELQEKGWIKVSKKGSFVWKAHANPDVPGSGRASTWILTNRSYLGKTATKEYVHWTSEKQNTVVHKTTNGGSTDHHKHNTTPQNISDGGSTDYHNAQISTSHGGLEDYTINIPPIGKVLTPQCQYHQNKRDENHVKIKGVGFKQ